MADDQTVLVNIWIAEYECPYDWDVNVTAPEENMRAFVALKSRYDPRWKPDDFYDIPVSLLREHEAAWAAIHEIDRQLGEIVKTGKGKVNVKERFGRGCISPGLPPV